MTTQDSLNQLEKLLIAERRFFKDKFSAVYPGRMIDECKYIISEMKIPPKVYSNEKNGIKFEYKTENAYIAVVIYRYDYGLFIDVNNTRCSWAGLATAYDVANWWNALTSMVEIKK